VPLKLIEGAGHASYVEQPAAIAAILRDALAS
jgi:pimeloyl-ACP methyl ester carboxylesterase